MTIAFTLSRTTLEGRFLEARGYVLSGDGGAITWLNDCQPHHMLDHGGLKPS